MTTYEHMDAYTIVEIDGCNILIKRYQDSKTGQHVMAVHLYQGQIYVKQLERNAHTLALSADVDYTATVRRYQNAADGPHNGRQ